MVNPSSLTLGCLEGTSLSRDEEKFIKAENPAGVTLFARNLENKEDIKSLPLARKLQALVGDKKLPFMIALDQEGGQVARMKHPDLDIGPAFSLCGGHYDSGSLLALKEKASLQGKALLKMGVNVNFAPVLDVTYEAEAFEGCSINNRAFGSDVDSVTCRASAFLSGLQTAGVFACLKHYPGIGRVAADTHHKTARLEVSKEGLWEKNLRPFRSMHSEAELIMVAHCIFPDLSPVEASRSSLLITDILRQEMGYQGLILCDDLTMQAVYNADIEWEEYVIASVAAGCDMLLICSGLERWQMACDVLKLEAKKSPAFRQRVEESSKRIQKFRQKLPSC